LIKVLKIPDFQKILFGLKWPIYRFFSTTQKKKLAQKSWSIILSYSRSKYVTRSNRSKSQKKSLNATVIIIQNKSRSITYAFKIKCRLWPELFVDFLPSVKCPKIDKSRRNIFVLTLYFSVQDSGQVLTFHIIFRSSWSPWNYLTPRTFSKNCPRNLILRRFRGWF